MVLSAALDKGLIFLALVAILTSVIGGIYYLSIIKEMFFSESEYKFNTLLSNIKIKGSIMRNDKKLQDVDFDSNNIILSSPISFVISTITLIILLFLFMNKEWLSMGTVLVQILFNG
jgi:NADH-ubiquinone oxidoreductase chain 2